MYIQTHTYMLHLFIHLSVGLLLPLSYWNNAAINMGVQLSLQDPAFNTLDMYSEVRSMDHGSSIFHF